jgi:predicted nucleotide-binding protein
MSSTWVRNELAVAASATDRFVVPIILKQVPDLPSALGQRQWVDLSNRLTPGAIRDAAAKIADATARYLKKDHVAPPIRQAEVPKLAERLAREARGQGKADEKSAGPPDSVFVVHGHDEETLRLVCAFLNELQIKPVVLSQSFGPSQSLLQKFFQLSREARFAIVILTADDLGASRIQYEADGVAGRALQFRGRQNVILELGFFYGSLGWENVFVVYRKPPRVFPNFERPSDLDGAVFDPIDEAGQWRETLKSKLTEAGFKMNLA